MIAAPPPHPPHVGVAIPAATRRPVAAGDYHGATSEHRRVRLVVSGRRVTRVRVVLERFACATFGDVGPLRIAISTSAAVGRGGRVSLTAGPPAERLTLHARFAAHGRVTGTLRVRGTIATGDPCVSRTVRFAGRR